MKRYDSRDGLHCHSCPSCSTVWQHPTPPWHQSRECFDKWHSCPRCGTEQLWKSDLGEVERIDFPWQKEDA